MINDLNIINDLNNDNENQNINNENQNINNENQNINNENQNINNIEIRPAVREIRCSICLEDIIE